jgi:hypothetical protein
MASGSVVALEGVSLSKLPPISRLISRSTASSPPCSRAYCSYPSIPKRNLSAAGNAMPYTVRAAAAVSFSQARSLSDMIFPASDVVSITTGGRLLFTVGLKVTAVRFSISWRRLIESSSVSLVALMLCLPIRRENDSSVL